MDARRADDIPVVPLDHLARTDSVSAFRQLPGGLPVLRDPEQPDAGDAVIARRAPGRVGQRTQARGQFLPGRHMALILVGVHVDACDPARQPQADVAGAILGEPAVHVFGADLATATTGVSLGRGRLLAGRQRERPVAGGEIGPRGAAVGLGAHAVAPELASLQQDQRTAPGGRRLRRGRGTGSPRGRGELGEARESQAAGVPGPVGAARRVLALMYASRSSDRMRVLLLRAPFWLMSTARSSPELTSR